MPLFRILLISIILLARCYQFCYAQNKENKGFKTDKKSLNGSTVPSTLKPADIRECPVKVPIKPDGYDVVTPVYIPKAKANLLRSTNTKTFNQIEVTDIQLNIPIFKLFKNNKTELTIEGEQQFKELIEKVRIFLSTNTKGKPITIYISGSASQIPTSFNPSKANNNLKKDGSSIPGETSIENNYMLAKARADELAKKLKQAFPIINIINPGISDIKLGKEEWTKEHQKQLILLKSKNDKIGIEKLFEPFQKDQWVKVESADKTNITLSPEAMKMYMVSTTPSLKTKLDGKEQSVKTIFIVSKTTFDKVGPNKTFNNISERDKFLKRLNLKIFHLDKDSLSRWYLLSGKSEIEAFNTSNYDQKVFNLYKVGISDIADHQLLEKLIHSEIEKKYRF